MTFFQFPCCIKIEDLDPYCHWNTCIILEKYDFLHDILMLVITRQPWFFLNPSRTMAHIFVVWYSNFRLSVVKNMWVHEKKEHKFEPYFMITLPYLVIFGYQKKNQSKISIYILKLATHLNIFKDAFYIQIGNIHNKLITPIYWFIKLNLHHPD